MLGVEGTEGRETVAWLNEVSVGLVVDLRSSALANAIDDSTLILGTPSDRAVNEEPLLLRLSLLFVDPSADFRPLGVGGREEPGVAGRGEVGMWVGGRGKDDRIAEAI